MCCYPSDFEAKFRTLLADQADAFFQSLAQPSVQGLRVNLCKTSANAFLADSGLSLTSVPWCAEGFYVENPAQRPGKHPYHEAGVYYLQDPSAMAPVTLLAPRVGDRVLDLCAAPGGKSTQIAALIGVDGFLLANEIHPQRSRQLSQNIERMGFANTRREARQLVSHAHFTVNGHKVNIPSYQVKPGDVVAVREKSRSSVKFKTLLEENSKSVCPKWIEKAKDSFEGKIVAMPARDDIDYEVAEHLIVELY